MGRCRVIKYFYKAAIKIFFRYHHIQREMRSPPQVVPCNSEFSFLSVWQGLSLRLMCHVTVFSFLFCSPVSHSVNSLWIPGPAALSGKWEVFENRFDHQIIVPVSEWRLNVFIKFLGQKISPSCVISWFGWWLPWIYLSGWQIVWFVLRIVQGYPVKCQGLSWDL